MYGAEVASDVGHKRYPQSAPPHPPSHTHSGSAFSAPSHVPCPEQPLGQMTSMHAPPPHPASHAHVPLAQIPCPEQSPAHGAAEQSSPPQCESHTQVPFRQLPCPEQLELIPPADPGQRLGYEQSGPSQATSQMHVPLLHAPGKV